MKLLVACFEVPGFGGASTSAYRLFERFRFDGLDAAFLNLIHAADLDRFRAAWGAQMGNPRALAAVHNAIVDDSSMFGPSPELVNPALEACPVMLGVDYIAALFLKRSFPRKRVLYLTAGSQHVKDAITFGIVPDLIAFLDRIRERRQLGFDGKLDWSRHERAAVQECDLVVTHADAMRDVFVRMFPGYAGRIHPEPVWFAEWICEDARAFAGHARPFADRDIDALFAASSWSRREKHLPFVERIAAEGAGLRIHVAGECPRAVPGATMHGLVADRARMFELFGRARAVVCPSILDAAPGVLFEAAALGANVIASRNCGNWKLCHPDLLAHPFDAGVFLDKIRLAATRKFDDNLDWFLARDSYRDLFETLRALDDAAA